jgi:1-aminocyclopropane-1-carboxylate deaminase/D-cysteine desulfhydrase-like pyridoxal-dependent ACC family enzyme
MAGIERTRSAEKGSARRPELGHQPYQMGKAVSAPAQYTPIQVRELLNSVPRICLSHLPTPLDLAPRLSERLGITLRIKREDCAGLTFGGNYARAVEFTLADALAANADAVIHGAAGQSNHCRQVAAGCARLGLECHLVVRNSSRTVHSRGNLLLDHLLGAVVHVVDAELGNGIEAEKSRLYERLSTANPHKNYYLYERDRISPLATLASAECFVEIFEQSTEPIDVVYLSSAGANQAGFLLARDLLGLKTTVIGVAPIDWDATTIIGRCYDAARALLGLPPAPLDPDSIENVSRYIGPGYAEPTPESLEAMTLAASHEAIVLDPVYTGKAFAALIADAEQGVMREGTRVIFVHTGGTPVFDLYGDDILKYLGLRA